MSDIIKLLRDKSTILALDMDGVLSKLEFGKYTHFAMNDDDWAEACKRGENFYTKDKVIKKMQKFLSTKNMDNIYVVTKVYNDDEIAVKKIFLKDNYNILDDHIYCVFKNSEKLDILKKIKQLHPEVEDYQICIVDDTVDILNDIMDKSNFSTAHISSFLDI